MAHFRTFLVGTLALALSACGSDDASDSTTNPGVTPQGTPDRAPLPEAVTLPIVFVHGFAGSAQQYESQAIRFVANGYPRARIRALDHDGVGQEAALFTDLVDGLVEQVRQEFGVQQVYLVGHSRGTSVSNAYMGDPTRAAKVAKYIALDGGGCGVADGLGIPCLAPTQACRAGAANCVPMPGQAHVEVATSAESFVEQYRFLVGEEPKVVEIVRQDKPVELRGRAVNFPANTGRAGAILEIWKIDAETGARQGGAPVKTFNIAEDGEWGPLEVSPEQSYEMGLILPDSGTQHFYLQRYLRSSHFVRLLSGPADSPIRLNTNRGDNHAALIAIRMREWYANDDVDKPGNESTSSKSAPPARAGISRRSMSCLRGWRTARSRFTCTTPLNHPGLDARRADEADELRHHLCCLPDHRGSLHAGRRSTERNDQHQESSSWRQRQAADHQRAELGLDRPPDHAPVRRLRAVESPRRTPPQGPAEPPAPKDGQRLSVQTAERRAVRGSQPDRACRRLGAPATCAGEVESHRNSHASALDARYQARRCSFVLGVGSSPRHRERRSSRADDAPRAAWHRKACSAPGRARAVRRLLGVG